MPTFAFEFKDQSAPQRFLPPVGFPYGAYHASELQYLFERQAPIPSPGFTADQQALADTMVGYWTRFAKRGDPNDSQAPAWPGYDATRDTHLSLAPAAVQTTTGFGADHRCSFWVPLLSLAGAARARGSAREAHCGLANDSREPGVDPGGPRASSRWRAIIGALEEVA